MRLELVMQGDQGAAVWLGTHGLPGYSQQGIAMLTPRDAMRLARRVRNVILQELAAIEAATTKDKNNE